MKVVYLVVAMHKGKPVNPAVFISAKDAKEQAQWYRKHTVYTHVRVIVAPVITE